MSESPDPAGRAPAAPASAQMPAPAQAPVPAIQPEDGAPPPDGYNPADYRWVPVRRRPRYDGWTEEKQRRFIEVLADTGIVTTAAKAVGMSRESANRLKRSPHGAAFARAWDAARLHAGGVLEDVAFERALEGEERPVFDEWGEVVTTKRVVNDRLLMFLLRNLKPERYGEPRAKAASAPAPEPSVAETLEAMEPLLPAPPERLLPPETLADELDLADTADGTLPHFLSEQRPAKSAEQEKREAWRAQEERRKAVWEKSESDGSKVSRQEFTDMCRYLDPAGRAERSRKRYK